jgi:hypothetical protein
VNFVKLKKKLDIIAFVFLSLFFLAGLYTFKDYGVSIDEEFQRRSGFYWLNYIINFTNFFNLQNDVEQIYKTITGFSLLSPEQIPFYGIIFDVPMAFLETVFKISNPSEYFQLRHFFTFLIFFISAIFFYKLLLSRYNDKLISLFGLLLYTLSPRIYGSSFYNNKDTLFLSLFTITIYFLFKYLDNKNLKDLFLFAFFSALSTSIRIIEIVIPIFFLLTVIIFFSKNSKITNILKISIIFILSYFFTLIIFWPYLWESPVNNFVFFLKNAQNYLINIKIFFNGEYINSKFIPINYIPIWIGITSPFIHIFLFLIGFLYSFKRFLLRFLKFELKRNYNDFWRGKSENKDFYILTTLLLFLIFLITFNVTLYNGWRHVFFLNFYLVYFATYAFALFMKILNKKIKKFFLIFCIISLTMTFYKMVVFHPFQNLYFNPFLTNNMKNKFDVDYQCLSGSKFLNEILLESLDKKKINIGVASFCPLHRSAKMLEKNLVNKIKFVGQEYDQADYIFTNNISEVNKIYNKKYNLPKDFIKYKEFTIDGVVVYEVFKKI